jgi:beta-fructofuranosidase
MRVQLYRLLILLLINYQAIAQQKPVSLTSNLVDYTSKVPQYNFATTLKEQEEQLKSNPLLLRFAASRKKLAGDKHRPIFHYVNPEGNLNDPNGLCYWQGRWHLFYQAYPPEDPRQHWGHVVSTDLVHWRDLPYAIYPNPERAVFSGSTLVENDRVIAMYHGTMAGNMVATSSDPLLLNWKKVTGKPVIPMESTTGFPLPYSVFDPSIWKKDSIYYSLSAGRVAEGPGGKPIRTNYLFRSKDLANWEYVNDEFVQDDRFTLIGDDGACPYFWPIGDRYILPFFSHMSGGQYFMGDYDQQNDKFHVTSHGKFNFGAATPSGVHAPSATPDGKGGIIIIFNMNPGKPTQGWNQIMTLPRRLTLIGKDELGIEPTGDIESLRYNHQKINSVVLPANKEVVLNTIKGNAMEIIAEIDPKNATMIEMNVLQSPDKEEYTRITFFKEKGFHQGRPYEIPRPKDFAYQHNSLVTIESSHSSILPDVQLRAPETAPVLLSPNEPLKLHVFIDKSVVEVFVNGKQCLAVRVYPGKENSIGVSLSAQGQDAELKSLDAWQMKSIYE